MTAGQDVRDKTGFWEDGKNFMLYGQTRKTRRKESPTLTYSLQHRTAVSQGGNFLALRIQENEASAAKIPELHTGVRALVLGARSVDTAAKRYSERRHLNVTEVYLKDWRGGYYKGSNQALIRRGTCKGNSKERVCSVSFSLYACLTALL